MLLLNPPSPANALANREGTASFGALSSGFLYPPHTLAVIVAVGRAAGLDVPVIDAVADKLDLAATAALVRAAAPDCLGVYSSWGTIDADRDAIAGLRQAFPQLPIVAIGTGIRHNSDELLVAGASHVLLGDPELAAAKLASGPLPAPGIVHTRDLLPQQHNHAGLIRYPAALPRPAWDAVPWRKYGFLTLFGARGCDDKCKFCAYVVAQGRAYRPRPAQDVAEEMIWLAETFQPRRIMVRDLVFAQDRTRTLDIARRLIAADFRTPWECESRPEHFDPTLLKALAKAGCTVLKLGIESADPEHLAALGRVESAAEAAHYLAYTAQIIAAARRYGIITRAYVMAGLPGQTQAQMEQTAAYLRQARPTFVHARPYIAYPRVPLGPAQSDEQIARLAAPIETVAAECQAVAARKPSLLQRVARRIRLAF